MIVDENIRELPLYLEVSATNSSTIIPVGEFDCRAPGNLTSNLTAEGYTMRMKYVTIINAFRDVRYFYFIPELTMPQIDDLGNFTVQIYT